MARTMRRDLTDKPLFDSEAFPITEATALRHFWNVEQLAEFLRVPKSWIYERTRGTGPEVIPHFKIGKYVRFDPNSEEFRSWLESHRIAPSSSHDPLGRRRGPRETEDGSLYTGPCLSDRASQRKGG